MIDFVPFLPRALLTPPPPHPPPPPPPTSLLPLPSLLRSLNLAYNGLGKEGAAALGEAVAAAAPSLTARRPPSSPATPRQATRAVTTTAGIPIHIEYCEK